MLRTPGPLRFHRASSHTTCRTSKQTSFDITRHSQPMDFFSTTSHFTCLTLPTLDWLPLRSPVAAFVLTTLSIRSLLCIYDMLDHAFYICTALLSSISLHITRFLEFQQHYIAQLFHSIQSSVSSIVYP